MQIRIQDQSAFILHRRDYQNSSLILELFTLDYGRISVLAPSAKKRRDTASFQVCNQLLVGWSGRSELKTLTQIESSILAIPADCLPSVFYINELLLYLLPKHEEHQNIFQQYQSLLVSFTLPGSRLEPLLRQFEISLLSELGYMPDLSFDSRTKVAVDSLQKYCVNGDYGVHLADTSDGNTFSGAELLCIQQGQFNSQEVLSSAKRLMRQLIDFNLQGRTLQSRKFYQQMTKK